jgi:hypothetical protein
MIRLFLFSFLFVAPSFAQKTFELRYQGKEGEVREYSFKTLYKARLTTLQDVHNLAEELEGRFSETILETGKDGVLRVQKELRVQEYKHNGQPQLIPEAQKGLVVQEYRLDPMLGKIGVLDSSTFIADDLMEMVIPLPSRKVGIGQTWKHRYSYNLPTTAKTKIYVPGAFRLAGVKGKFARIVGKFKTVIPTSEGIEYEGRVSFNAEVYLNLSSGILEHGRLTTDLRYYSRTPIAKAFFESSKKTTRIGYRIHFVSLFERIDR